MESFRELKVIGQLPVLEAFIQAAMAAAHGDWTSEGKWDDGGRSVDHPYFIFVWSGASGLPKSKLFLMQKSSEQGGELKVVNIVPSQKGSLTHQQYNRIVKEFHDSIVQPAAAGIRVLVVFTEAQQGIEHLMTPETYALLTGFSRSANKSTGSAHPADLVRWFQFLVATHRENTPLDPTQLAKWLVEEKWPDEQAGELAQEYEFGRGLLRYASEEHGV